MADVVSVRVLGDDDLRLRGDGLNRPAYVRKKAGYLLHEDITDDGDADEEPAEPHHVGDAHDSFSHERSTRDKDDPKI